jgi:small subunit ribosomal protein S27e
MSTYDLANPPKAVERNQHKLQKLVQEPQSCFYDVKCHGCFQISVVFSHATSAVFCNTCSQQLATPTGGKAKINPGCAFRVKK